MAFNFGGWCKMTLWMMTWSVLAGIDGAQPSAAQGTAAQPVPTEMGGTTPQMEQRLQKMTDLLMETKRQLEQSQEQMRALTVEIEGMRRDIAAASSKTAIVSVSSSAELADVVARQGEEQEVQQAEIRQHEQTKVETSSKYALHLYGLVLFSSYSNTGVVDNINLPSIALPRSAGTSQGSVGATMRQTVLGVHGTGPKVFGAQSSADLSTDFFSSVAYDFYGNSVGNLRLRRADVGLEWNRDAVHVGVDGPLISPNSPDSFAAVGVPPLAWAGNLWSWSTQLRFSHTMRWNERHALELQGGLWDAPVVGQNTISAGPIPSPGELSRRPGLEGRVAYRGGGEEAPLVLGIGGYSGRQSYYGNTNVSTWAITGDWKIPLTRRFGVRGEIYRGVGLGGFGGGAYKDVLTGTDPVTNAARTIGLNAVGGWSQITAKILPSLELHAAYGQDGGFASDFRKLELYGSTYPLELSARNRMVFGNLVYRPKTYLIFSPEFRRIESWQISGSPNVANVVTVSAGYQF